MKRLIIAMALLGTLSQCTRDLSPSQGQRYFGEEFGAQPGQTLQLSGQSEGSATTPDALVIQVLAATDGRCRGVCVWAGRATATVKVSRGKLFTQTLELCLGDCDGPAPYQETDQVSFNVGSETYVLHLKSIDSREKQGQPAVVERVTLLLEKK